MIIIDWMRITAYGAGIKNNNIMKTVMKLRSSKPLKLPNRTKTRHRLWFFLATKHQFSIILSKT